MDDESTMTIAALFAELGNLLHGGIPADTPFTVRSKTGKVSYVESGVGWHPTFGVYVKMTTAPKGK